jgi:hypothetical protein
MDRRSGDVRERKKPIMVVVWGSSHLLNAQARMTLYLTLDKRASVFLAKPRRSRVEGCISKLAGLSY